VRAISGKDGESDMNVLVINAGSLSLKFQAIARFANTL